MSGKNKFGFAPLGPGAETPQRKRSVGPMGAAVRDAADNLQESTNQKVEQRRRNAEDAQAFRAARDEGRVLVRIPLGEFARGQPAQPAFAVGGQRFAFNVCYEDLFGEELAASVRAPVNATVLVNVSNIAWFGDSHALPQHLVGEP